MVGRGREKGLLRTAFDRPDASLILVTGPPGIGKTTLVCAALDGFDHTLYRAPPLPESHQRAALTRSLQAAWPQRSGVSSLGPDTSWDEVLAAALTGAGDRPTVLVVDDAHRWIQSRARFAPALFGALASARRLGLPFHVVLVSPEPVHPTPVNRDEPPPMQVRLAPLPFRSATHFLPGAGPADLLRAYAVFGGVPDHLRLVEQGASLLTNIRRLVLERGAPLGNRPLAVLEGAAQTPIRYVAILASLASGEADWSAVHAGVPDLTASGQVAPYLKRLEDLGLVEVRRSLDASPRSRGRRYRITDPFFAFWCRFVLPFRDQIDSGSADELVSTHIRPALDDHLRTVFPAICRQHMALDVMETTGANAREWGSLWGPGFDIPVAGMLSSGAAFYGTPVPADSQGDGTLERLDREIRETRYGFGRERRLRVMFSPTAFPGMVRRHAARRHDVLLVDGAGLAGA